MRSFIKKTEPKISLLPPKPPKTPIIHATTPVNFVSQQPNTKLYIICRRCTITYSVHTKLLNTYKRFALDTSIQWTKKSKKHTKNYKNLQLLFQQLGRMGYQIIFSHW